MKRPEIFKAYGDLEGIDSIPNVSNKLSLRDFIRNYAVSLSSIVRAFPKANLDINALEAHVWDRLKYFYRYESFGEVNIESKEDVNFINQAIKLIKAYIFIFGSA